MPRMSDGDPCTTIDLCDVQRIFGQSWMEEANQDHRGYCTKCRITPSRRRSQRPCQESMGGSENRFEQVKMMTTNGCKMMMTSP